MKPVLSALFLFSLLFPLAASAQLEPPMHSFLRADANTDGAVDISDAAYTFSWLFLGADMPNCLDSADANDDGVINITDGIYTLAFLFTGGDPIPAPGITRCDHDPTDDQLHCVSYLPCRCGGIIGGACAKGQLCDRATGLCQGADIPGECVEVPEECPAINDPVCGCDGVTYRNDCERRRAGAMKASDGPCDGGCGGIRGIPCRDGEFCDHPVGQCDVLDAIGECEQIMRGCPDVWDPVCGCDGVTYSNDCERINARVQKDHDGACGPKRCGGIAGLLCDEGEYCDMPSDTCNAADMLGECVMVTENCPEIRDPVCGCDGRTYSNDCERIRAGVAKAGDGECGAVRNCGGFAGLLCEEGQYCDMPEDSCNFADMLGECVVVAEACPEIWDPVCGCDGVTYSNDCDRIRSRVPKAHDGECE